MSHSVLILDDDYDLRTTLSDMLHLMCGADCVVLPDVQSMIEAEIKRSRARSRLSTSTSARDNRAGSMPITGSSTTTITAGSCSSPATRERRPWSTKPFAPALHRSCRSLRACARCAAWWRVRLGESGRVGGAATLIAAAICGGKITQR